MLNVIFTIEETAVWCALGAMGMLLCFESTGGNQLMQEERWVWVVSLPSLPSEPRKCRLVWQWPRVLGVLLGRGRLFFSVCTPLPAGCSIDGTPLHAFPSPTTWGSGHVILVWLQS